MRRTFGRADDAPAPRPRIVGVTGTQIHAGRIADLDQNTEVRDEKWIGTPGHIGIADKMVRDPVVNRSHASLIGPLVDAFWDVDAASESPLDLEIADFVSHNLFERVSWARFVEQVLTFIRYGVSLFEQTDELQPISTTRFPLHPGRGRGLVLTGLHHRPAPTIYEWVPNARNAAQLALLRQWSTGSDTETGGVVEIPASRLLRFTWEQEGANFRGFAPARAQYGAWKAKLVFLVLEMIKHEKAHVPTPVITLPDAQTAGEDEIAEAEAILVAYRSHEKGYVVLPGGYKLDLKTIDGTTDIHETITRLDQYILFPFAANYEVLGQNGTGSHALAGTQKSTQEIVLARFATFISDTLNIGADGWSLVERLVRANYGRDVALPRIVARSLPTRDWSKVLPHLRTLGEIGMLTPGYTTERFIRDVIAFPQETRPYVPVGTRALTNASTGTRADASKLDASGDDSSDDDADEKEPTP